MKKIKLLLSAIICCTSVSAQNMHHEIDAKVHIETQSIEVTDNIKISESYIKSHDTIYFYLNAKFNVSSMSPDYMVVELPSKEQNTLWKGYYIKFISPNTQEQVIPLQFSGKVDEEVTEGAVAYARGFSNTSGLISDKGVSMSGSTVWVPDFDGELYTFNLTVTINKDWGVVSEGTRTRNEVVGDKRIIRYESHDFMNEIHLIAAKWTEYNKNTDHVLVQAFLRTPDEELANRYIDATVLYLNQFEKLLGKYPFSKFALVENFWNTGFGMPSFTLLGEQIIRFPFILHSSYPHELLHNWWGNGVFVKYNTGNWCEGLTAYMADHLIKEQRGQAAKYRRSTLEKFTNFVNDENDFPITQFTSRHNPAEEAIGYGKVLMFNNMLRTKVGDELFIKAYRKFYKDNLFKYASFEDIRKSFEEVSGKDLKPFFDQWITRKGAPTLKLSNVKVQGTGEYELSFTLSQIQKEDPFTLLMPVVVYLEGEEAVWTKNVDFTQREQTFTFKFKKRPLKIDIDPEVNVFRRLDKNEIPPALSQLQGAREATIILPKTSPHLDEYAKLADTWRQMQEAQGKKLTVVSDADITKLPDMPVWILGFENKFVDNTVIKKNYSTYLSEETMASIDKVSQNGSLVYSFVNANNNNNPTGFVGSTLPAALTLLTRKLPHYGKYSYLGFEGEEAKNVLKGEFPVLNSPLSFYIEYDGKKLPITAKLQPRKALMY